MKTAIDNYEIGKQKEIHIDNLPYLDKSHTRFICPECKEFVHIVDKGELKYFSHFSKKHAVVDECTRRVDGVPTQSIYERLGLPIYLRKSGNQYQLKIGFRSLPSNTMNKCIKNNFYIEIKGNSRQNQKYYVNYDNFSDSHITYLDIDCLSNDNEITILYSSKETEEELKSYWSNRVEMLNNTIGGLFSAGENGGKLIHKGDNIETFKKYYWVSPNGLLPRAYKGINFVQVGRINFYNKTYYVFEGSFDVDISDKINFKNIYNYLYNNMKVFLLEKNALISPVWPPCVRNEDGYLLGDSERVYCIIDTNSSNPTIYTYKGNNPNPSIIQASSIKDTYLMSTFINSTDTMISVDRRLVSNGVYIKSNVIEQTSEYSVIQSEDIEEYKTLSDINIFANGKVDVYLVDRLFNIYKKEYSNEKIVFDKLKNIESVWILSNENLIKIIKIVNEQSCTKSLDEKHLFKMCKKLKSSRKILINSLLVKDINYIIENYPLLRNEFIEYKVENKIPMSVAMIVRGISYEKA